MAVALLSTIALAVAWTAATAVQLAASALIMGGTEHPLRPPTDGPGFVNSYLYNAVNEFINLAADTPTGTGGARIDDVDGEVYAVTYPAEFFPVFGRKTFETSVGEGRANLNLCARGAAACGFNQDPAVDPGPPTGPPAVGEDLVIFGYSQSAVVASLVKRDLIANPREGGATSFFLLANPMRPNGGILALGPRGLTIPILGIPFYGPTPTNSCELGECMPTVDTAVQYDILGGDAPSSLTNVLALMNAMAGYLLLHGNLANASFEDALYQDSYGDTDYYLYPTERLPILMPLSAIVPSPILTALDAPLRAAIEGAYHRGVNPGIPMGMGLTSLLPFHDPVRTVINIVRAIPVGLDDAIAEMTGNPDFRPFGTTPTTSPFGVGGRDLPPAPVDEPDVPEEEESDEEDTSPLNARAANESDGSEDDDSAPDEEAQEEADDDASVVTGTPATQPGKPKVRGPIEFDSRKQASTPTTSAPATGQPTTGEPEPDEPEADTPDDSDDSDASDASDADASDTPAAA
ncbi:PE-PPE domain-containing protein [Mycolicibacterium flavescens]|uniref:PE-PPE domain-containing protein n=1 Tax=Mycolicibacterium flavescens TaxID=1776 RepID=UPI001F1614AB|nr:PE-PPE domain-containing protein [Mycolicibacterium flavescens]